MKKPSVRYVMLNGVVDEITEPPVARSSYRFAVCLAVFAAVTVSYLAWLSVATGMPALSAVNEATAAPRSTPEVLYFPSRYVNKATNVEPASPTF